MTPCPVCCPWNMPLTMPTRLTPHGVALLYQEWIVYDLHVRHHQTPDHWDGEIEGIAALLRTRPDHRLEALVRLAA